MEEEHLNILPTYVIWLDIGLEKYKNNIISLVKEDIFKRVLLQRYGFTEYIVNTISDKLTGKLYEILFIHPDLNFQIDVYINGFQIRRNVGFTDKKQYMDFTNIINYVLEKFLELIFGKIKSERIEFLAVFESYTMLCIYLKPEWEVKKLVPLKKFMVQYNRELGEITSSKPIEQWLFVKNKISNVIVSKQDKSKIISTYYRLIRNTLFAKSIVIEKPNKERRLFRLVGHGRNFFFRKPGLNIALKIGEKSKENIRLNEEIEIGSEIYTYDYFIKEIENNIVMGYLSESKKYLEHECRGRNYGKIFVDHAYHTMYISMQKIGEPQEKINTILSIRETIYSINYFMYLLYNVMKTAYKYFKTSSLLAYKPLMVQIK